MQNKKLNVLFVTEAALEHPEANPLSATDQKRVNGVVRTYQNLAPHLAENYNLHWLTPFNYSAQERGMRSAVFHQDTPFSVRAQKSIRLVVPSTADLDQRMAIIRPDHVHIATEGPMGWKALHYFKARGVPITTAFHTNWQDYAKEDEAKIRFVPKTLVSVSTQKLLAFFHRRADGTMAATTDLKGILTGWGLNAQKVHIISRGVDTDVFHPRTEEPQRDYVLYVGRIAPGKGVERFCKLDTKGLKKIVVGTGDLEGPLREQYPDVHFAGYQHGRALAEYYNGARLFVLPSDTETFGMTVTEALACGTPVVALDRGGHQPILNHREGLGVMRSDLQAAFDFAHDNPDQFMSPYEMAEYMRRERSWRAEAENFQRMVLASRSETFEYAA